MEKIFSYTLSEEIIKTIYRHLFIRFYFWRLVIILATGLIGIAFYFQMGGHWAVSMMLTASGFGLLQLIQFARYWRKRSQYWVAKTVLITLSSEKITFAVGERVTAVPYHEISTIQRLPSVWLLYIAGSSDSVILPTAVMDQNIRDFLLQKTGGSQKDRDPLVQ